MPVLDIDLDKIGNTLCNIKATMLYPENPVERLTYYTLYQNISKRHNGGNITDTALSIDEDVLRHLRSLIETDVRRRQEEGIVTGGLLVLIKQLSDYGAEASVKKAIHIMSHEEGIVNDIPTGRTKLQQYWSRLKPVAHLWADVYLHARHIVFRHDALPLTPKRLVTFLARAEWFRRFGESHIPTRVIPSQPTLQPERTWSLPLGLPLPDVAVTIPPLTKRQQGILGTYKHPSFRPHKRRNASGNVSMESASPARI